MIRNVVVFFVFVVGLLFLSSTAAADVIMPEEEACIGGEEREACEVDGVLGECRSFRTCRPNYDDLDEDGNPTEMCWEQLSCRPLEDQPDGNGEENGEDPEPPDDGANGEDDDSSSCSSISVNSGMVPMVSFVLGAFLLIGIRRRTKRAS